MSGFQSGNSSSSTRGHERYYSRRVVPLRCFRVTNRDGLYRGFAFQSDAGLETPRFPEISVAENDPPTTGNEPSTAGKSESFVEPTAAINWTVDGSSAFRSRAEVRLDWNNCFQNATQKSIQISSLKTSESPYIRESWWGSNTTDILIYYCSPFLSGPKTIWVIAVFFEYLPVAFDTPRLEFLSLLPQNNVHTLLQCLSGGLINFSQYFFWQILGISVNNIIV